MIYYNTFSNNFLNLDITILLIFLLLKLDLLIGKTMNFKNNFVSISLANKKSITYIPNL